MSGGRVELGMGAGWYEAEHAAYGIPFPPWASASTGSRSSSRSSPACGTTPDGGTFSFTGTYYTVADSPGAAQAGAAAAGPR